MTDKTPHIPVLLEQSVNALITNPDGIYIDATFGAGGHSSAILQKISSKAKLVAFDADPTAVEFNIQKPNFILFISNYIYIRNFLMLLNIQYVDGIIADLGISSMHIDQPERGFSFKYNAPLDMRFNPKTPISAKDIVNSYSEQQLTYLFKNYAQLPNAHKFAKAIVNARQNKPIQTTFDLVNAVEHLIPQKIRNKTLAQLFQAIRIETNNELDNVKKLLLIGKQILKPGGRFVIISFHSLEDRLVKNFFKTGTFDGNPQKDIYGNFYPPFKPLNKKVITPSDEELKKNPRAKSAKLRIAYKLNYNGQNN